VRFINKKYQAVIFDLFGTLIDKISLRDHINTLNQMASAVSAPPDEFIRWWFATFDDRGLGVFKSLDENIDYICRKLGLHPKKGQVNLAAQINIERTALAMRPCPFAAELLSALKTEGYRTCLITNCSAEIPGLFDAMPLAALVDVAVFSALERMQKPDPRIYRLAAKRLAVKPETCLFIGDGDCNELTGAARAGMHPVLIRNPDEDRADVHRADFEGDDWQGPVIYSLKEALNLVK